MSHDATSAVFSGCLLAMSACLLACVGANETLESDDRVAVSQANLTVGGSFGRWPNGRVPVCFHPRSPGVETTAEYLQQTERIRTLAEQEYESIPNANIDFVGWEICPNLDIGSLAGQLRIIVAPTSATSVWITRECGPGTTISTTGDCKGGQETIIFVKGAYYSWGVHWDTVALHELGHALGVDSHELDRRDSTDPDCIGDKTATSYLTVFDIDSIMTGSYCGHWPGKLSPLDELGFEIMYYDGPFAHPIGARSGFQTARALLLRQDDSVVTDWTLRGAAAEAYKNPPLWSTPQLSTQRIGLPGTFLPYQQVTAVSGSFSDFKGTLHGSSGNALVDDGLHAALVTTVAL